MCCDLQRVVITHQTKKCGVFPIDATLPELVYSLVIINFKIYQCLVFKTFAINVVCFGGSEGCCLEYSNLNYFSGHLHEIFLPKFPMHL
jgi:hypothetical protein